MLLELPEKRRQKISILAGYELKPGFAYFFPLEEQIILKVGESVKSSPKSTSGRLFNEARAFTDFNSHLDVIKAKYKTEEKLRVWLLVQPLVFSQIVYPGLSLNQLRFFTGPDPELTRSEANYEFKENPFLFVRNEKDELVPAQLDKDDDLEIHLELSGRYTGGLIGLKARRNPHPIDLKKENAYEIEDYFELIIKGDDKIIINEGEYYLFASKEFFQTPPHLNLELGKYYEAGFRGSMHFAGFIDNGFNGDLVFEIVSYEKSKMELKDGALISPLDVYKTEVPDRIYGSSIDSNYNFQFGPRPSKQFKPLELSKLK